MTTMSRAKRRLTILWATGALIPFATLTIQTLLQRYTGVEQKIWSWFLPTVLPTLSLVIGAVAADAVGGPRDTGQVGTFVYRLTWSLSFFYLALVTGSLFVVSFVAASGSDILDRLVPTNFFLSPTQGLAAAMLGVFFRQRGTRDDG